MIESIFKTAVSNLKSDSGFLKSKTHCSRCHFRNDIQTNDDNINIDLVEDGSSANMAKEIEL